MAREGHIRAASMAMLLAVACASNAATNDNATAPNTTDSDAGTLGGNAVGDLPCAVDTALARNCRKCHSSPPLFGAPMPLVTLADLHADARVTAGKKVYEVVGMRIHDDASPMPQPPNPRLGPTDMATLDAWIAAGAPSTKEGCTPDVDGGSVAPEPLSCTPDQKIRPTSKFAVTNAKDLYVCYGFDTTAAEKLHVVAGGAHIDNTKVVHHVLLYQSPQVVSGTPAPCGAGGGSGWRLVTGWAPGAKNFELPPQAGFAEEAGTTHWALQIHYNNAQGLTGQVDESGFDLCTTKELRPNDADILATGTMSISIPPRSTVETTCEVAVSQQLGTLNIVSTWAHMHRLGRAEYAKRIRDGVETTLLDAPAYEFSTGAGAQSIAVQVAPGDTIRTMCRWQNGGDTPVGFGEGTTDEMCFAFLTYYPKIKVPNWDWRIPALSGFSRCTSKTP